MTANAVTKQLPLSEYREYPKVEGQPAQGNIT